MQFKIITHLSRLYVIAAFYDILFKKYYVCNAHVAKKVDVPSLVFLQAQSWYTFYKGV